jgi:hypothetical protein
MKIKKIILVLISVVSFVICANEFTVPKIKKPIKISARKIKENTLEKIGEALKLLIKLDLELLNLRADLQTEFEAGLYSDGGACINSSSKSERQQYLDTLTALNIDLEDQISIIKNKIKKLNIKIA